MRRQFRFRGAADVCNFGLPSADFYTGRSLQFYCGFLFSHIALEVFDSCCQFREAGLPCELFLEFFKGTGRRAPHGFAAVNGFAAEDSRLAANYGAVFQFAAFAEASLAANDNVFAKGAGTGKADLGGNYGVLADFAVVANVNEIIQLYAGGNPGVCEGAAIDGGIGADFHVIANLNNSGLREFPMPAFAEGVSKTVGTDYGAGVDFHAVAQAHTTVEGDAGMDSAIFADPASGPDYGVRADLCVFANMNVFTDHGVGADAYVRRDLGEGRDNRCGMYTCSYGGSFLEQRGSFGEG
jgi:hypothetical protein